MNDSQPNIDEITRSLRDAGVDDENMSAESKLDVYKALRESKGSSQSVDSVDISFMNEGKVVRTKFVAKEWMSKKRVTEASPAKAKAKAILKDEILTLSPEDYDSIDVSRCPPTTHKPLKHVKHPVKTSIVPIYCRSELKKYNFKERFKIVTEFHMKAHRLAFNEERRLSSLKPLVKAKIWFGPPKQELKSEPDKPSSPQMAHTVQMAQMETNSQEDLFEPEKDPDEDFQITRSGRQIKRKNYFDDPESPPEEAPKKPKPALSTKRLKTLSNQEIMKRSKLFREPSSRCEKMFDNLKEQEEKKKKEEAEMERFRKTLDAVDDENVISDESDVEFKQAAEVVPRRIVPPSRRRALHSTKKENEGLERASKQDNGDEQVPSSSSSKVSVGKKTECPICGEFFLVKEIDNHAWKCMESQT